MATPYGIRLRAAYKEAGTTQTALAAAVGSTQAAISEACRVSHGSTYTAQFAKVCGVDAFWLATGDGEMKLKPQSARALHISREFDRQKSKRQEKLYAMFMQLVEFSADDSAEPVSSPPAAEPPPAAVPVAPVKRRLPRQT